MNVILDLIGSAMIASLLILMMITFQYQLRDTAERTLYAMHMIDHMDQAATKLNNVIALAGIGMPADSAVVTAATDRMVFRSYWDWENNQLTPAPHSLEIKIVDTGTSYGKALTIVQDGVALTDLGYIFWIDEIRFQYYNKLDMATTTARQVRAAEIFLTFRRNSPMGDNPSIRAKVQQKCYLMNTYMRGA